MSEKAKCRICGEPLPDAEEMFNYHGYSGPCPKSPIAQATAPATTLTLYEFRCAIKECMSQRGQIAFIDEYLPGGIFYADTQRRIAQAAAISSWAREVEILLATPQAASGGAQDKPPAAPELSRDNHAWLASTTPRPDLIAISEKVWGVRFDGQMICAPTIEEAVTVLRSGLAAQSTARGISADEMETILQGPVYDSNDELDSAMLADAVNAKWQARGASEYERGRRDGLEQAATFISELSGASEGIDPELTTSDIHYVIGKIPKLAATHPLQESQPIPESLEGLAKEIAEEFCGGSEAVEDAILAKLLASHPSQDKPPAAPLCGKRIPETGLGCTLEPGHQGRHDVDVTKVSEAPLRKRLEGVLPSIAIRIHAYMSAAQNLPYEEGETCEECEDIARELIELAGEPPNEAGQVISQEPIKIELRSLEEATESVSKWPAWKREYSEQHPFLTSQDPKSATQPGQAPSEEPPIESTMSIQKACETIAEKEIKRWYSHSEGARAAHNIWSEIRALAARPKEQPK